MGILYKSLEAVYLHFIFFGKTKKDINFFVVKIVHFNSRKNCYFAFVCQRETLQLSLLHNERKSKISYDCVKQRLLLQGALTETAI